MSERKLHVLGEVRLIGRFAPPESSMARAMLCPMAPRDPARPLPGWLLAFDIVLAAPITIVWLGALEPSNGAIAALLHGLAFAVRTLAIAAWRRRALRSLANLLAPSEPSEDQLRAADAALHRFSFGHALVHALAWIGYFALGLALSASTSALLLDRGDLMVGAMLALGTSLGAFVPITLTTRAEVEPDHARVLSTLEARDLPGIATPSSLATRLVSQSVTLVVAAALIVGAVAWQQVASSLAVSLISILAFVAVAAVAQARSILAPLERARVALARLTDVGDIEALAPLPVARQDELGDLTRNLNRLLDGLTRLTAAARALEDFHGPGQLADAMRHMVERTRTIDAQNQAATAKLHATAAALRATAQTQELVHEQQLESVNSIGVTMTSLERSAAQIAAAVVEVSDNAESTLAATDELAQSIAALDGHTQGIRALLEIIRDVASRSDLLALNGALEAMRVGEAGRGFALVADEMRRLAERVTGTVGDVRRLVGDIAEGSESSVDLTELGRQLAEGTTNAAREIASATYRQTSETEQVARAVRELAAFVAQTKDATEQTRRLAGEVEALAEVLGGGRDGG